MILSILITPRNSCNLYGGFKCKCIYSCHQYLQLYNISFNIDCIKISDLDAIGKPQSGLFLGNVGWLGSYSECTKSVVNAHYCLAYITVPAVNITEVRISHSRSILL